MKQQMVEIYKIEKIIEAVPAGREYMECHIFDEKSMDTFMPIDVAINYRDEFVQKRHLPITRVVVNKGGIESNRYIAYDPSLERELGYPVTVMTELLETQNELSEALRKYENELLKNEQMVAWYEENIKNAPLLKRLKWVLGGVE